MDPLSTQPTVVVVDNYDSFTHNIIHALAREGARSVLVRNDSTSADALLAQAFDGLLISAGPFTPSEAGICVELIEQLLASDPCPPLLGICLGHQCIAQALGGRIRRARRAMHGKLTRVRHDQQGILAGLVNPLMVARYNSLVVEEQSLPADLVACAWDDDDELMALRHRQLPLVGVQFHPESHLSTDCRPLFAQWVRSLGSRGSAGAFDDVEAEGRLDDLTDFSDLQREGCIAEALDHRRPFEDA